MKGIFFGGITLIAMLFITYLVKEKYSDWWKNFTFSKIKECKVYLNNIKNRKGIIKECDKLTCVYNLYGSKKNKLMRYKYCKVYDGEIIYVK